MEILVMHALKLRKIGTSTGVILPKEMLDSMRIGEGDRLFADVSQEGLYLTPFDPEFEAEMESFGRTRKKYRNALRQLSK